MSLPTFLVRLVLAKKNPLPFRRRAFSLLNLNTSMLPHSQTVHPLNSLKFSHIDVAPATSAASTTTGTKKAKSKSSAAQNAMGVSLNFK